MLKEMEFDIFYDKVQVKNGIICIIQQNLGTSSGLSFKDACERLMVEQPQYASKLNIRALTFKNHELYGKLLN